MRWWKPPPRENGTGPSAGPGKALNRRSSFFIGMSAAAGAAVAYGIVELIVKARSVLVLIVLALLIVVLALLIVVLAVGAGFAAATVPPLAAQTTALVHDLPHYMRELQSHNSQLGRLNAKYYIQQRFPAC